MIKLKWCWNRDAVLLVTLVLNQFSKLTNKGIKKCTAQKNKHNVTPSQSHVCEIKLSTQEATLTINSTCCCANGIDNRWKL